MRNARLFTILTLALFILLCQGSKARAENMGTGFTYQGRLIDGNDVADGLYDFQFKLFDDLYDPCDANQVAGDVNKHDIDVIDGYFTVELDFNDPNAFNGDALWLEIGVRDYDPCDVNAFTTLSPRQEVTPTPYALHTRGVFVGNHNTFVGEDAGYSNTIGIYNTFLGNGAGLSNTTGFVNTFLGSYAGASNTTGHLNTFLGPGAGYYNTTGNGNVFIGFAAGSNETGSGKLYIANSDDDPPLIYGEFNIGKVGIGTTSPEAKLDVASPYSGPALTVGRQMYSPSIAARSDANGGWLIIDSNAPGSVGLNYYNDANVVLAKGGGNVGIGTTEPKNKLDLEGGAVIGAAYSGTSTAPINGLLVEGNVGIGTTIPKSKLEVNGQVKITGGSPGADKVLTSDANGLARWQTPAAGGDSDWTISDSNMYSAVSGNVGIGTNNPQEKLHVSGKGRFDLGSGQIHISTPGGWPGIIAYSQNGNRRDIVYYNSGTSITTNSSSSPPAADNGIFIAEDGDVGIGTTIPTSKLEVNGQVKITGGSPGAGKVLTSDANGLSSWQTPAAGGDSDWTISDSNMYSAVSGNVGIGTTSPESKLDVASPASGPALTVGRRMYSPSIAARSDADGGWLIIDSNAPGSVGLNYYVDANVVLAKGGGNVGIGETSPSDKLDVGGNINIDSVYKIGGETVLSATSTDNIMVGIGAGENNTANNSTFVGSYAGYNNTMGEENTFIGKKAGYSNTEGYHNTFIGSRAGENSTLGENTFVGFGAGYNNQGTYSTFVGYQSGYNNDANGNSFLGWSAGKSNTTGNRNTFLGFLAGYANDTGHFNTFVGSYAGYQNNDGYHNTFIGDAAGYSNTTGYYNTFLGKDAGFSNTTGHDNIFIGSKAGYSEKGSYKLYIDVSSTSTPLIHGDFLADRLGISRVATANRFEVEGEASKATAGGWLANSDARIKMEVETITDGLEKLAKVRLVSFKYTDDYRAQHSSIEDRRYLNVISQEFQEVFPDYVKGSGEKLPDGDEILQVDSYPLTVYSAAAVQELHEIVKAKDAEIAELKQRVSRMEDALAELLANQKGGEL